MKKLLLLAAFGLFASPAFAQSNATVNQSGTSNDALLDQSSSTATITQSGTDNQVGGLPFAAPPTSPFTQAGGSNLDVEQYGKRNTVHGSQSGGSMATIDQNYVANVGDGNAINLTQSNTAEAFILQDGPTDNGGFYGGNRAYVTQDDGYANIKQAGDNSEITLTQQGGTGNQAYMEQSGNVHNAVVDQNGTNNYVDTYQRLWRGDIDIDQDGDGQQVYLDQTSMTNAGGGSYATIDQNDGTGTGGNSVGQAGDAFDQIGDGNSLDVMQSGTMNLMLGSQDNGSMATVDQTGVSNEIRLEQDDATATMTQNGDNNRVQGVGGAGTFGLQTNGSTLILNQMGDANVLSLDQNNGATANVMQDGLTNTAEIVQN